MSELILRDAPAPFPALSELPQLPGARTPVAVRPATMADVPFIDALQKKHGSALGFMHFGTLEGKIAAGHVLIAEGDRSPESLVPSPGLGKDASATWDVGLGTRDFQPRTRLGYVIGNDKYLSREELGVVYQMAVVPEARRLLVAATLLQALFDRSAYGCRLFSCWCAQDLEAANRFWEAMGFVPIAFRTGSRKGKRGPRGPRTHIFWQKAIRAEDAAAAARGEFRGWWFPSETKGGAIGEARLVFPIPPGTKWWDEMPTVLPGGAEESAGGGVLGAEEDPARGTGTTRPSRRAAARGTGHAAQAAAAPAKPLPVPDNVRCGLRPPLAAPPSTGSSAPGTPAPSVPLSPSTQHAAPSTPKRPRPRKKNDPRLVAAARELRDRYLEAVQHGHVLLEPAGKYELSRLLPPGGGADGSSLSTPHPALGSGHPAPAPRILPMIDAA